MKTKPDLFATGDEGFGEVGDVVEEEEPVAASDVGVHALEDGEGGDVVEDGQAFDGFGEVLGEAGGDAGAAIVSDDRTAVDAEVVHELEDVAGHGAFVVAGSGFFRCAVFAEVGGDDAEVLGDDGDLVTPRKPGFWEAVEQHDGWSVGFAGFDEVHFEVVDGDIVVGEFGRHGGIRGGFWRE